MSTRPSPATADVQHVKATPFLSILGWPLIALLGILAIVELKAPDAAPATAPATEFSSERALAQLRNFAVTPHPIGSKEDAAVKDYLFQQLSSLGMNPQVSSAVGVAGYGEQAVLANTHDILGRLPGSANSRALMLMAHYDSVDRAPGAGDDGAGVVAILEAVRALRAGPALKNDLIVLLTDGEEAGLLGAEAFVASHPWLKDVGLILNFEGRGDRGPSLLFETSRNNALLINAVARSSAPTIGSSLFYSLYKLLPNDTDFTVFRPEKNKLAPYDIPGLNFAFGENLDAYHSRLDTVDHLSPSSLQHHGAYALSLAREFGQMDLTQLKNSTQDDIFFDWLGSHLITYSQSWVLPGEILAGLLLIFTIALKIRRLQATPAGILRALLPSLALLLGIPLAMVAAAWLVSFMLGTRILLGDSTANACLLWGFVLLGACVGSLLFALFRKRYIAPDLSLAGLLVIWILSLGLAVMLPAGSYLLFWPVLLVTLGLLVVTLAKRETDAAGQALAALIGTATTVLIFAPVIHLLYVFLTLQLITIVAAGLLLGVFFLVCAPWVNIAVPRNKPRTSALILLSAALVILGIGFIQSHPSNQHPRHDTVAYSVNADDHSAVWISYDRAVDDWTSQFFGDKTPQRKALPDYLGGSQRQVLSAAAPTQELPGPTAEVTKDSTQGDIRNLQLNLKSPREARMIFITLDKGAKAVSIKAGGREIQPRQGSGFSTINLIGPDSQGIDLELAIRGPSPVSFWLMDQSSGLPGQVRPRPDDLMSWYGSDLTLVSRKYTF